MHAHPRTVTIVATIFAITASAGAGVATMSSDRGAAEARPQPQRADERDDAADLAGTIVEVTDATIVIDPDDGARRSLRIGAEPIDLEHLRMHVSTAQPVEVWLDARGRAERVVDLPPRSADERRRALALPDALDDRAFRAVRRGMLEAEVAQAVGVALYVVRGPGGAPCWQWARSDGIRDRFYEACFERADPGASWRVGRVRTDAR